MINKTIFLFLLVIVISFLLNIPEVFSCTAIVVGRLATTDGNTINTHANDCYDCDFRIVKIPGKKHPPNSLRAIPPMKFSYPRYVGERSPFYNLKFVDQINPWNITEPMGYIPEVSETYAVLEGTYSISNEHGVSLGESTCGAKLTSTPISHGGSALLEITELGRIALERSKTAREAIQIIGDLAVKYGYFSAAWGEGNEAEGGESYSVTDGVEAWILHISPTGDNIVIDSHSKLGSGINKVNNVIRNVSNFFSRNTTENTSKNTTKNSTSIQHDSLWDVNSVGGGAVWVAKRVPDNHVSVVTNSFIIRNVPYPSHADPNVWMMSSNLHATAKHLGFWDPSSGPLDFKRAFGLQLPIWKEPYVSRRQWRVLSQVAPSLGLRPEMTSFDLPFSVQPEHGVNLNDIRELHRDHYEGTVYDTNVGLMSGPYGNPNRYDAYDGVEGVVGGDGGYSSGTKLNTENTHNENSIVNRLSTIGSTIKDYVVNTIHPSDNNNSNNSPSSTAHVSTHNKKTPPSMEHFLRAAGQDSEIQCRFDKYMFISSVNSSLAEDVCVDQAFKDESKTISRFNEFFEQPSIDLNNQTYSQAFPDSSLTKNMLNNIRKTFKEGQGDVDLIDRTQGSPLSPDQLLHGHTERTISLFRTSYSVITVTEPSLTSVMSHPSYIVNSTKNGFTKEDHHFVQKKQKKTDKKNNQDDFDNLPIFENNSILPRQLAHISHLSLHQAKSSVYTPIFPALPYHLPPSYYTGSLYQYNHDSAWWLFSTVSNYCEKAWRFMIRDVEREQTEIERRGDDLVLKARQHVLRVVTDIQSKMGKKTNDTGKLIDNYISSILNHYDIQERDVVGDDVNMSVGERVMDRVKDLLQQVDAYYHDSSLFDFNTGVGEGVEVNNLQSQLSALTTTESAHFDSFLPLLHSLLHLSVNTYSHHSLTISQWRSLYHRLLTRYRDGYRFDEVSNSEIYTATPLFYPTWWLKAVRFWKQPLGDAAQEGRDGYAVSVPYTDGVLVNFTKEYDLKYQQKLAQKKQQENDSQNTGKSKKTRNLQKLKKSSKTIDTEKDRSSTVHITDSGYGIYPYPKSQYSGKSYDKDSEYYPTQVCALNNKHDGGVKAGKHLSSSLGFGTGIHAGDNFFSWYLIGAMFLFIVIAFGFGYYLGRRHNDDYSPIPSYSDDYN